MQKLLGAAVVGCSGAPHDPIRLIMPRIKSRATVAVFASCHVLLPSMGEIGDRVGGFLCAPPPSLIGEHAAMSRVGQRFRVDSCGTTDRIFGSAINMPIWSVLISDRQT